MNNLIIGFCHQSCAFWKIGLNGYQLLLLGTSKSGFAKRERKDGLLMHAPIPAVFSLFFYHFLSFISFLFYFQFLTLLPWVVPHLVFSFLGSLSLGAYYSLTMGFFPFDASAPLGSLLSVFFSLPCFSSPFFLPWLPSFYSKLIQWDFSLLPLGFHQLFLVCCRHPFKITHSPIGCPCHCLVHVCCNATHFTTKFPFVCSYCIPLPHYLAL